MKTTARCEQGSILLGVMLLTMMMAAISLMMGLSGQTELLIARSDESTARAHAAAEAGLSHAVDVTLSYLQQWEANGFGSPSDAITALLEGPDRMTGTPPADADNGSLELFGIPRPPGTHPVDGAFGVSYSARVFDEDDPGRGFGLSPADTARIGEDALVVSDSNGVIVVQATGYGPGATSARREVTLSSPDGETVSVAAWREVR